MENNGRPDYTASFTDLMASLAVVFLIVAGGVSILLMKKSAEQEKPPPTPPKDPGEYIVDHGSILATEFAKILEGFISKSSVFLHGNTVRVVFNSEDKKTNPLSFKPNVYRLENNQVEFVTTRLKSLISIACKYRVFPPKTPRTMLNLIVLEGHTDRSKNPVGEGCYYGAKSNSDDFSFCNNVRLSAKRATEVFYHLRESIKEEGTLDKCFSDLFLVSGRGSSSPFEQNASQVPEVSDIDRRVEFVFHIVPVLKDSNDVK